MFFLFTKINMILSGINKSKRTLELHYLNFLFFRQPINNRYLPLTFMFISQTILCFKFYIFHSCFLYLCLTREMKHTCNIYRGILQSILLRCACIHFFLFIIRNDNDTIIFISVMSMNVSTIDVLC